MVGGGWYKRIFVDLVNWPQINSTTSTTRGTGAMGIAHGKLKDALSKKKVEFQIIDKISSH